MNQLPGITRQDEEQKLAEIIGIAGAKLDGVKRDVRELENELHAMQQEFDESDKEQQALWHNTDARFREANQELRRAAQARKKPYFGRIDFVDETLKKKESYYVGRSVIAKDPAHPEVIDWRAPIASVYYDSSVGMTSYSVKGEGKFEIDLLRKRTYEIENDKLKDFYDSDVVANDELLTKYLAKNKRAVLGEIIATIQQEQNEVIRKKPQHNMIIQGAAGSGKTTVAMHRISYILYNYDLEFKPEDFYVIGSNQVLLNYITGVLPELNVYGVSQMTMEQLFVRLLYEDWDPKKYQVKPVVRGITEPIKGTRQWFRDLEKFSKEYEWSLFPKEDVRLEKNHVRLMSGDMIESLLERFDKLSRADKVSLLTERLLGKLENEICGKYYSYSEEEKKKLRRTYSLYFGRREWKGSIFEIYDAFLRAQANDGKAVAEPMGCFDVYDLAALAYLYKRLKETEIIREAGHVVIDEAQDFGMMAYCSLKYCLSTCTYTIMGDVAQNIFLDYGLNDWQELRELMLPNEFDYFGLLRKSYRNTVEISEYATNVLHHGSFQVYPVQPIIRHGEPVVTQKCSDEKELLKQTESCIKAWQKKGYETIAVVCSNQEEANHVSEELGKKINLLPNHGEGMEFGNGVLVLPIEYVKGLEFDAVLIYDCSEKEYPEGDANVKRLYVAVTRALHELTVLYQGELTQLIARPVTEEELKKAIVESDQPKRKPLPPAEEKTHAQIAKERAEWGEVLIQERHYVGPRRIEISEAQRVKKKETKPELTGQSASHQGSRSGLNPVTGQREAVKVQSYYEEKLTQGVSGTAKQEKTVNNPRRSREFGSMPEQKELQPLGHARIDCSVKMCLKEKQAVSFVSSYGTLRIEGAGENVFRICFQKGQGKIFPKMEEGFAPGGGVRIKEAKDFVELSMPKVTARVMRKTGEIAFYDVKGKLLLTERVREPRQVETSVSYEYFEFSKKEELYAKSLPGQFPLKIGSSAKVISFGRGENEMPGIHSSNGYELLFPTERKTLCCNIPMYGPYISQEGEGLEYYFKV
ncbi:MAG: AAA family ATPase [Lachnospiraceae bacterium]|nr:AAA family ATPase [Lachnospiraceae bacterium]